MLSVSLTKKFIHWHLTVLRHQDWTCRCILAYDNAASTARKLGGGLKSTQVRAIVDLCVSLGLFDKALFTTDGILTSRAIQSRYLDGIARRTGEIPIIVEYWLLEVTPRAGLVFVHKNGETAYKNPDNEQQKPSFCTEDYIRQAL
uniref:DUF4373 domain-containing protein n=1 Tax=Gemmiger formicilis TaxID=745368 RepID=UPI004029F639